MSRLKLQQLVNEITSLGLVFILAVGMMTGCGKKKEDNKADSMTQENTSENNANEESENTNKDRTAELIGVWQLNADTPAGDPYIFELEFDKGDHASYCGYSMSGNNWFQNFCYDGSVSHKSIIGQDEGPGYEYFIEYEDGCFDICIEASELDENGTETDRFSCEYNVKISTEKDSIELKHISGKYIGFDETEDVVTFVRVDKAINPGDSVTATEGQGPTSEQVRLLEEAITIFPVSPWYSDEYKSKRDITNVGWEVLGKWKCIANNQKKYAGLSFITEELIAPDEVFSAYGYFNSGDKVDCIRTDTAIAGTDGCPYARDLYYINSTPIFAYYHSATDGSLDNRYYFEAGRMIEWIEGNGNDDSSRVRYYVSDYPLNARWKETEKQVLKDVEYYGAKMLGFYYD